MSEILFAKKSFRDATDAGQVCCVPCEVYGSMPLQRAWVEADAELPPRRKDSGLCRNGTSTPTKRGYKGAPLPSLDMQLCAGLSTTASKSRIAMPSYKSNGRVDCDVDLDLSGLEGKTAVVTGGKLVREANVQPPLTEYRNRGERYRRSLREGACESGVSLSLYRPRPVSRCSRQEGPDSVQVCFGDLDVERGRKLEKELSGSVETFGIQCLDTERDI